MRLSVHEHHGEIRSGFFERYGAPCELLEGFVVRKPSKTPRHNSCQRRLGRWLHANAPIGYIVGVESSITFENSELEPDGALIRGGEESFLDANPQASDVALVVEVGDASLERDRTWKLKVYAKSGIPHYWIIDIPGNCLEVYSRPEHERYALRRVVHGEQEAVVAIAGADLRVRASDLLGRG